MLRFPKPRALIILLVGASMGLALLDAGEHWLKARAANLLIAIHRSSDSERERMEEIRREQYESVITSGISALALGASILLIVRSNPAPNVA